MSLNNSYTKKRNSSFSSYSSYSSNNISTKSSTIKVAIRLRPLLPHEDFEYWTVDINKNIIASKSENKKAQMKVFLQ